VTCCGKLFQRRGPATTKDRSPRVERVVRRTTICDEDAERRRLKYIIYRSACNSLLQSYFYSKLVALFKYNFTSHANQIVYASSCSSVYDKQLLNRFIICSDWKPLVFYYQFTIGLCSHSLLISVRSCFVMLGGNFHFTLL